MKIFRVTGKDFDAVVYPARCSGCGKDLALKSAYRCKIYVDGYTGSTQVVSAKLCKQCSRKFSLKFRTVMRYRAGTFALWLLLILFVVCFAVNYIKYYYNN